MYLYLHAQSHSLSFQSRVTHVAHTTVYDVQCQDNAHYASQCLLHGHRRRHQCAACRSSASGYGLMLSPNAKPSASAQTNTKDVLVASLPLPQVRSHHLPTLGLAFNLCSVGLTG